MSLALVAAWTTTFSTIGASWPQTTAEATQYQKTSSYADVVAFLDALQANGAPMRVVEIGKSHSGKAMPLVICHRDPNIQPEAARRARLPIVYVQANIHAGEVEGKEAALQLLRELAQNPKDPLLDKMVLIVAPIYNIDGNEKWGPNRVNRSHQDGPDPVGERASGQGFDLNRDCMKAESLEFRAVLDHVWKRWNPDAIFDLHTTNGTRHGFVLTYAPGLFPNCDPGVMKFTRDEMLPKVRKDLQKSHGYALFDYGDVQRMKNEQAFATFACDPRYVTNYGSARNRIAILSEAASFQPFKLRVDSTRVFVRACLEYMAKNAKRVVALTEAADRRAIGMGSGLQAAELGVRFDFDSRGVETIPLEVDRPEREINHMKAPTEYRTLILPIFDRFKTTRTSAYPWAYVVPQQFVNAAALAHRHGIQVERLLVGVDVEALRFEPIKRDIAGSPFQGHRLQTLEGRFAKATAHLEAGDFLVRTAQPLGPLAFALFEPESVDGALAWGFLGEPFGAGDSYPILKLTHSSPFVTRIATDFQTQTLQALPSLGFFGKEE